MKKLTIIILAVMVIGTLMLSSCSSSVPQTTTAPQTSYSQAPWTANPPVTSTTTASATTTHPPMTTTTAPAPWTTNPAVTIPPSLSRQPQRQAPGKRQTPSPTGTIGLSTGGAKDVSNFRENILNNYLPLPTDVTYEGLFYDYFFDTGALEPATKLYSPSYTSAVTRDPLSHQTDYYLSVGLNSGLKAADFQRKKLNLVIVLDDSGSMNSQYNQYYYDGQGNQIDAYAEEGVNRPSKMQTADEAVVSILDQLNNNDRVAMVTFNSNAYLNKPMGAVNGANMSDLKNRVLNINAGGSTNLAAGIQTGTQQFNGYYEINNYDYENRMIVLTDAEPNTGDFSGGGVIQFIGEQRCQPDLYHLHRYRR